MSWSSNVRVLGVCGVWLALQVGCGGNPPVGGGNGQTDGGTSGSTGTGGNGANAGTLIIPMGGENGEGGGGDEPTTTYVCGNGELEPKEFCDDGNTADGDGCSADCTLVDEEYDCSVVGEECVKVVICGNGVIEGKEACDDGNEDDDDGCSGDCSTVEDGFGCIRPGEACVKLSVCGNGERERGEECDDGHAPANGDGCDEQCQFEPDYLCPIPGEFCVKEVCGDGVRTKNEACDNEDTEGCLNCQVQPGWHCNTSGCKAECGDGMVVGEEKCDDGNATGGDGCSSGCKVEPFFACDASEPSKCKTTKECGNNVIDPGEACDDGKAGSATCTAACTYIPPKAADPVCGNKVIETGETCEPPNANKGCSATCQVEPGYTCTPGAGCTKNPTCGDGTVDIAQGEKCDPPQVNNGCSATCQVESGWTCSGFGPSVCTKPNCGNGVVETGEKCDDKTPGNTADGCIACQISTGWVCPSAGKPCQAICGDGMKLGTEECDDGDKDPNDGCSAGCKVEPGWKCDAGKPCEKATCGDGNVDSGEGCDDKNTIAGDGCGPTCQKEPKVTVGTNPTVAVSCGDGLITGTEACDDGAKVDGDGCKSDCSLETPGWTCTEKVTLPKSLEMAVKYRDFRAGNAKSNDGHTDFQYEHLSHVDGLTGAPCKTANAMTCGRLDSEGKPQLVAGYDRAKSGIMSSDTFKLWWRDNNSGNVKNAKGNNIAMLAPVPGTLTLTQQGATTSEVYVFDSNGNNFYPLDGKGFDAAGLGAIGDEVALCNRDGGMNNGVTNVTGNPACDACAAGGCQSHNFNFTTELRYFFQYKGGETLAFTGDDDVWVYINGRLAVDIGGLHSAKSGQVVLGDDGNGTAGEDSNCSAHSVDTLPDANGGCYTASEKSNNFDDRFGLEKGEVYEIVLFHAERHTSASNFKLTLAGFLAPRTFCTSSCGDGHKVGDEFCDDGANNSNTKAGACRTDCTFANFCGDGVKQTTAGTTLPAEICDDGSNTTLYTKTKMTPVVSCAPGCLAPAYCGDNIVQSGQGEQCDNGASNNDSAYSPGCKTDCTFGGYCGDGKVNGGTEECDRGTLNGKESGPGSCTFDCKPGPYCGDGHRDAGEDCDDGVNNELAGSHCSKACKALPYCGDGIPKNTSGEVCDWGAFATDEYGGCTDMCVLGPHCGDGGPGNTPDPEEECDYGTAGNTGAYDGCTSKCGLGPHCGDGIKNGGEVCDNGFNEDEYATVGQDGCGVGCTPVPYCGDGIKQANFELCDLGPCDGADDPECNRPVGSDAAYNGCDVECNFGPFCGDGKKQAGEKCDDGRDNTSYSPEMGGCGYDCQDAPWCGDGVRNGPEQCDLPDGNTGEYGGCNEDCTFAPRCGDGEKNGSEQCDDGPTGSLTCTPTCKRRSQVE